MSSDSSVLPGAEEKMRLTTVERLHVPVGGQEIELQQIEFEAGGLPLLRTGWIAWTLVLFTIVLILSLFVFRYLGRMVYYEEPR